jgi:hypothetical protein
LVVYFMMEHRLPVSPAEWLGLLPRANRPGERTVVFRTVRGYRFLFEDEFVAGAGYEAGFVGVWWRLDPEPDRGTALRASVEERACAAAQSDEVLQVPVHDPAEHLQGTYDVALPGAVRPDHDVQ